MHIHMHKTCVCGTQQVLGAEAAQMRQLPSVMQARELSLPSGLTLAAGGGSSSRCGKVTAPSSSPVSPKFILSSCTHQ